jgi:hypothetical protein
MENQSLCINIDNNRKLLRGSHSWKYEGKMISKEGTELELLETGAYESFPVLRKKWIT